MLTLIGATTLVLAFCAWRALDHQVAPEALSTPHMLTHLTVVALWLVAGLCVIYYAVRRLQLEQIRAEVLQEVMVELAILGDPFFTAEWIATLLQSRARLGERVFILQHNSLTDIIHVVAWAGDGAEKAAYKELKGNRGIARRAVRQRATQIVGDVTRDPDFFAGGLPERGSELSVPIFLQGERGGDILGTINVQSNATFAFDDRDADILEQLAKIVGAFGRSPLDHFDSTMEEALEANNFYRLRGSEELASSAVGVAHVLFGASLAFFVRLTVGTDVPYGDPFTVGDFNDPDYLREESRLSPSGEIADWVQEWRSRFFSLSETLTPAEEGPLSGLWHYARDVEEARAMACLPIGSRNSRTGVLILIWRSPSRFTRFAMANLLAFAREIAPYIEREQYRETVYLGFARLQAHFHSSLAEAGLARGTWERTMEQILALDAAPTPELLGQSRRLKQGLKHFLTRLRSAESDQLTKFSQLGYVSLREALVQACGDLQEQLPGMILRDIGDEISAESNDTKLILYTLIMEAVRNALVHGRDSAHPYVQVQVRVRRRKRAVLIRVSDDGRGFEPERYQPEPNTHPIAAGVSPDGIFFLDLLDQERLGAPPIDWTGTEPGRGTRLSWTIPALPPADKNRTP